MQEDDMWDWIQITLYTILIMMMARLPDPGFVWLTFVLYGGLNWALELSSQCVPPDQIDWKEDDPFNPKRFRDS